MSTGTVTKQIDDSLAESSSHRVRDAFEVPYPQDRYFRVRSTLDRFVACLLLIPGLPLIGLLIVAVRFSSRGAGIFRQQRVGKDGQRFTLYKIRTMVHRAEAECGPTWCIANDPRITTIGKFLRLLHLDELPQLFNVVRGEMSLIGPRPERPEFAGMLVDEVDGYADRLTVKPGITGLAQIFLPADETIHCVRQKVEFDRKYILTAGWILDLKIAVCTTLRMCGIRGGRAVRLMGLSQRELKIKIHKPDADPQPTSVHQVVPQRPK